MTDRRSRNATRWAWAASIAVHGLAFAAGAWVVARPGEKPAVGPLDTNLLVAVNSPGGEPFRFSFVEAPPSPIPDPTPPEVGKPVPAPVPAGRPAVRSPRPVPSPLAGPIATLVRDMAGRPATAVPVSDVVTIQQVAATDVVPVTTGPIPTTAPPNAVPAAPSPGATPFGVGTPVHGGLPAGRSIVYVLDCSGTMGLNGKLDRARAAVLATLAGQPDGVHVRVVTYSGRATVLDRDQLVASLARLEPGGASRHAEGVRAALKFDPDYVVLFTDADDAELAVVRPLLRGTRKPVAVSVAGVSADGVASPVDFR